MSGAHRAPSTHAGGGPRSGERVTARVPWLGRRGLGLVAIACLLGLAGAAAPVRPAAAGCAAADGLHHVALVVEHGDGRILVRCVAFGAATISGAQALALSGVESATSGYAGLGLAVCQLDGEPTTYPPGCWTDTGPYWVMFVARGGGAWTLSSLGISSQTLGDGDAEGFRYDAQTGSPAPPAAPGRCPPTSPPTSSPTAGPLATRNTPRASPQPSPTPRPARPVPVPTAPTTATAPPTMVPVASAAAPATMGTSTAAPSSAVPATPAALPDGGPSSSGTSAAVPAAGVLALAVLLLLAIGLAAMRRRRTP